MKPLHPPPPQVQAGNATCLLIMSRICVLLPLLSFVIAQLFGEFCFQRCSPPTKAQAKGWGCAVVFLRAQTKQKRLTASLPLVSPSLGSPSRRLRSNIEPIRKEGVGEKGFFGGEGGGHSTRRDWLSLQSTPSIQTLALSEIVLGTLVGARLKPNRLRICFPIFILISPSGFGEERGRARQVGGSGEIKFAHLQR